MALPLAADHRPRTRGDCVNGPRPCPFITCHHHLAGDVDPLPGEGLPDLLRRIPETCSLDVADRDGATLEEVGVILGLSKQRVQQLEQQAMVKLDLALLHLHRRETLQFLDGLHPESPTDRADG